MQVVRVLRENSQHQVDNTIFFFVFVVLLLFSLFSPLFFFFILEKEPKVPIGQVASVSGDEFAVI